MTLIRWNPWGDFAGLHRDMDRYAAGAVRGAPNATQRAFVPAVDVHDGEAQYTLSFDLPGVPIADVEIEVHEGRLTVRGARKLEPATKGEGYRQLERGHGEFRRAFSLPENIDVAGIAAESKDGVVTVTLPKLPAAKPKRIEIRA